jgi:hypothetical protein
MRVFASVAHLTEVLRRPFLKNIDPVEIGGQVTERWIDGAQRLVGFDRRGDIAAARKIHIRYEELTNAPMATVSRLYEHFGLKLSAGAVGAMNRLLGGKSSGGYGAEHWYVPERFGIYPQCLAEQFAAYTDYFDISA